MSEYILTADGELYHYGVPGMKWGVRKSDYKTMNRQQRKKTRQDYYKTDEGKIHKVTRNTLVGTILGGPVVGVAAGLITAKRNPVSEEYREKQRQKITSGKNYVENLATTKTAELKSPFNDSTRVTGQREEEFWKAYAAQYERNQ